MTVLYGENWTLHIGDALATLRTLPDKSVQTCITSPPYFGLRDYGVDGQIGLESTPVEFVEALVSVFREVRRVLRDDGTLWVNIGDSYHGGGYSNHRINGDEWKAEMNGDKRRSRQSNLINANPDIAPKNLYGIPWRVAFALQADGWILRSDVIWHKPNPMPESVTDRPTKAHEYLFMFAKAPRYYYDAESVKEPALWSSKPGTRYASNAPNGSERPGGNRKLDEPDPKGRNRRSVWTVATRPFKGAHFATYPPALIEPCVLACSRPGDVVLDPFNGAGTTGVVALQHGRKYVGIELNPSYARDIAAPRLNGIEPPVEMSPLERLKALMEAA